MPIEQATDGTGTPTNPEKFVNDLAAALTEVVSDREAAKRMGAAGLERARNEFGWDRIADQTRQIYESLS